MFEVISLHEHRVCSRGMGGKQQQYFRSRKFTDRAKMLGYVRVVKNSSTYVSHELIQPLSSIAPKELPNTLLEECKKKILESFNRSTLKMLTNPPEFPGIKGASELRAGDLYGMNHNVDAFHYLMNPMQRPILPPLKEEDNDQGSQ